MRVHKNVSVRVHKWLCQLRNSGSITILHVTYPVDLHTVLCWSNGQMVNTYGQMQNWPSQVHHN
ncbi:hypothetical protein T11_5132 [Trichinella zimbabwensis]|uniref:Uncharacterized protein n=1 Tax=Trichinella zimbabwensis TaxID=268475 RepID=A0A0V1GKI2_9BILA|nr:hypothetical protein T11_5132 [Trichinella zimbabwensis]